MSNSAELFPSSRRTFLKAVTYGAIGAAGACAVDTVWVEPKRSPVVESVRLRRRLPAALDGLTICQLSDLHRGPVVSQYEIERAVAMALSLSPDLIVLTGDFVSADADYVAPCTSALQRLHAPLGVFAVLGNHDHWVNADSVHTALEEAGIGVLRNATRELRTQSGVFYIAGLDDVWEDAQDIDAALAGVPREAFMLLLVHEPDYADEVAKHPVDLQLSGHSHGGQVRLPVVGAPVLPRLGQKYPMGLYRVGNLTLYTNRGIGRVNPPFRFNCPPEITLFTLHAKRNE
ncbi:MAG: hypothetical protein AUJ92_09695 [Armatimonadetes bacterium CG2_30_59_28]|nr:MAG: hypothetical protein AUJ92_09695 [Armatimonadetes bacterium CG2_30_59_28]PIU67328.1 MAG: metallophosphoesterase [Armatimonadetes bacterium CG07_land_8_20_14_0_80_59_28]PIX39763.1 MAG: metallophosphoesterase [Armatimonadetes bacterium CG_4_8_14_3_um_filter_58_9]PIY37260.1 MAG: metallophosphoesterase [Armatimonadetes bacterium CG_4_10_14_3_um_filter_59_10]PJB76637.1 MAG: metallophosphoesterase [Armatimonadetes bacterium CG_4_9_14_3_um_filter_58_7]